MKVRIPIHARYAIPDEFASVEVSASVELDVSETITKEELQSITDYALEMELHLGEKALPYAMELLRYVQNNHRTAVLSPDQLRFPDGGQGGSGNPGGGSAQGR